MAVCPTNAHPTGRDRRPGKYGIRRPLGIVLGLLVAVFGLAPILPMFGPISAVADTSNLALNRPVKASSFQDDGLGRFEPRYAIDGSPSTRWSSEHTATAWIYVDLLGAATITQVELVWEAAYATGYQIQVSDDSLAWTTVFTESSGNGATDTIDLATPAHGRYVRMLGLQRATIYGYSLYEFRVSGSGGGHNIAVDKPAYAHYEAPGTMPKYAVDDRLDTRWSSIFEAAEWIYVDLGAIATITDVVLFWEDAYAVDYDVQVSDDAQGWTTVREVVGNGERINVVSFSPPVHGRYVRMLGRTRALSDYGYSLWEFQIYGSGDDPAVTPVPTPTPSGYWELVWSDDFNGAGNVDGNGLDRDNWEYDTAPANNNEQQAFTDKPENLQVADGRLVITAAGSIPAPDTCVDHLTSARIVTKDKHEFTYGRIEARMKLPVGAGLGSAFWMLGANYDEAGWPACGEIDIVENIGYEHWLSGTVHGPYDSGIHYNYSGVYSDPAWSSAGWHTYRVEWWETEINWYVDDTLFLTIPRTTVEGTGKQWVFDHPYFIILYLALGGDYPHSYNGADGSDGGCWGLPKATIDSLPQHLEVDWVRVYQRYRGVYLPLMLRQAPP